MYNNSEVTNPSMTLMKLKLAGTIKTKYSQLQYPEEHRLLFRVGNNLSLLDITKNTQDFICLSAKLKELYSFVVSSDRRHLYTVEDCGDGYEIGSYVYDGNGEVEKKFNLSALPNFMPAKQIQSIELYEHEGNDSVVFGRARSAKVSCLFSVDMVRGKLLAMGFVKNFTSFHISPQKQQHIISVCGRSFLKVLKAAENYDSSWQVQDKIPSQMTSIDILDHFMLGNGRMLLITAKSAHIYKSVAEAKTFTFQTIINKVVNINSKMFLFFCAGMHVKIYLLEGQNEELILFDESSLNIETDEEIKEVFLGQNQDHIVIRLTDDSIWQWKIQELMENIKSQHEVEFIPVAYPYSKDKKNFFSVASNKNLCLMSNGRNVTLWDLAKNKQIITYNFSEMGSPIRGCSLNPDGNSFCMALAEEVRIYRVLMNKFLHRGSIQLNSCSMMQYSHGGHLLACSAVYRDADAIVIINTLSLKKVPPKYCEGKVTGVVWNQHDDEIYAATQAKTVEIFKVSSQKRLHQIRVPEKIALIRYDNSSKKTLVSTGQLIYLIDQTYNVTIITPKIPVFSFIFPTEGIYFAGNQHGALYYSSSMDLDKAASLQLFTNQPFTLRYRRGLLLAQSASEILAIKVKLEGESLARQEGIVLVEVEEVNKFMEKIRILENKYAEYQNNFQKQLDFQRQKHDESLQENEDLLSKQLEFMSNRLEEIQVESYKQSQENHKVFYDLRKGQKKNVDEIEKMYELKIKLLKEKFLTLEQDNLEQKIKYQKIIDELQKKCKVDISDVTQSYDTKLIIEVEDIEKKALQDLEYKEKLSKKFQNLEILSENKLIILQQEKDNNIKNLEQKNKKLHLEIAKVIDQGKQISQELAQKKKIYHDSIASLNKVEKAYREQTARVRILKEELIRKDKIIEQKKTSVKQQIHQIQGLQKAKYVLGFRTMEIRNELQPKESIIEKLQIEKSKVHETFEAQKKQNRELQQQLDKITKALSILKHENQELEEDLDKNIKIYDQICSNIYNIKEYVPDKQWNKAFVQVYQKYIRKERMKSNVGDKGAKNSEQINKQLIHFEKSLSQVATGNEKLIKGKQKQVERKFDESAKLVYEYNIIKKEMKGYEDNFNQKKKEIKKLRQEKGETMLFQKNLRPNTIAYGRHPSLPQGASINRDQSTADQQRRARKGLMSAHKTMLWREDRKERSRIFEMARELEQLKQYMKRQETMIQELNEQFLGQITE